MEKSKQDSLKKILADYKKDIIGFENIVNSNQQKIHYVYRMSILSILDFENVGFNSTKNGLEIELKKFLAILEENKSLFNSEEEYKEITEKISGEKQIVNLKEEILKEKIQFYKTDSGYKIYGKTFESREELKIAGAEWNSNLKLLEITEENFNNMDEEIQNKVLDFNKKQKSLETVSHLLLSNDIKVYLTKEEMYKVYGRVSHITKDLENLGFNFNDNNYAIKKEQFEKIFNEKVKAVVNSNNNSYEQQTEEIFEEEEDFEQ